MNKKQLLSIIERYTKVIINLDDNLSVNDLTSNLQTADKRQIVFYRLFDTDVARAAFEERYGEGPGLLVINRRYDFLEEKENILIVDDDNFHMVQKKILDQFYPYNESKLKLVGVTGTNGKTTTVNLAMQISSLMGHQALSLGTLGMNSMDKKMDFEIVATTPSYIEFRKILHAVQNEYEVVFFEFSSHALAQERIYDIRLDASGWTNLTQDHLDYHGTMDEYFNAKLKVASVHLKKGRYLILPSSETELFKRLKNFNSIYAKTLNERGYLDLPDGFSADYNQSNLELAMELNEKLWKQKPEVDLMKINLPRGRFSTIKVETNLVIIDYAHTPDGLKKILESTKKGFPDRKVGIVFGCGGDRDFGKRKIMGEVAAEYANKLYITSDNPRNEEPEKIIENIMAGIKQSNNENIYTIVNRKDAITQALKSMRGNGILIIAGKGHEEYQEICGVKHHFSDFEVVENYKKEISDD